MARLADGDRDAFTGVSTCLWPELRRFAGALLRDDAEADEVAQRARALDDGWCMPTIGAAGLLGGLVVAHRVLRSQPVGKVAVLAPAALLASLTGAMGRIAIGVGGLLGLAVGIAVGMVPALVAAWGPLNAVSGVRRQYARELAPVTPTRAEYQCRLVVAHLASSCRVMRKRAAAPTSASLNNECLRKARSR